MSDPLSVAMISLIKLVPNHLLIHDDHQGRMCHTVLGKVLDNPLIRNNRQGGVCRVVLRKALTTVRDLIIS